MQANYTNQMEATDVLIGETPFHIFPFPAFKAANLTGELAGLIAPLLASLAPLLGGKENSVNIADMDIEKAAPEIGAAFGALSGDKLESLLRKLLLSGKNISVEQPGGEATWLTEDLSNTIFCGNAQDMFVLAFHVIEVNYSGFFGRFGSQFGQAAEMMRTMMKKSA